MKNSRFYLTFFLYISLLFFSSPIPAFIPSTPFISFFTSKLFSSPITSSLFNLGLKGIGMVYAAGLIVKGYTFTVNACTKEWGVRNETNIQGTTKTLLKHTNHLTELNINYNNQRFNEVLSALREKDERDRAEIKGLKALLIKNNEEIAEEKNQRDYLVLKIYRRFDDLERRIEENQKGKNRVSEKPPYNSESLPPSSSSKFLNSRQLKITNFFPNMSQQKITNFFKPLNNNSSVLIHYKPNSEVTNNSNGSFPRELPSLSESTSGALSTNSSPLNSHIPENSSSRNSLTNIEETFFRAALGNYKKGPSQDSQHVNNMRSRLRWAEISLSPIKNSQKISPIPEASHAQKVSHNLQGLFATSQAARIGMNPSFYPIINLVDRFKKVL